jgi:phage baseplate assembly protein W
MNIAFPYMIGNDGRTATVDDPGHIRQMIELLLFTHPGERVMRAEFGSGLLQYVFAGNSPEVAATLQMGVQAALIQWLGDVIEVSSVQVSSVDAVLQVAIGYTIRATGVDASATFERSAT